MQLIRLADVTSGQNERVFRYSRSRAVIGAITMARRLYAYDLTTAKQFAEALVRKQAESRSSVNFNDH